MHQVIRAFLVAFVAVGIATIAVNLLDLSRVPALVVVGLVFVPAVLYVVRTIDRAERHDDGPNGWRRVGPKRRLGAH